VRISGIVLAGGRSSRFGGQKLEATIGGVRLIDLAVTGLLDVADEVIVAAGEGTPKPSAAAGAAGGADPRVRVVHDAEPFDGPLAALAGALPAASGKIAVVVGGDMPAVRPALLRTMVERLAVDPGVAGVVLADGETARPLPMALDIASLTPVVAALVARGERSLRALLEAAPTTVIPEATWRQDDADASWLVDVDRPEDLEAARRRAEAEAGG
jgi:molybdopterin-guanine dinucleotide biosynthesis protein A